jgi:transient receptor potential cation channel subfamily M protein 7
MSTFNKSIIDHTDTSLINLKQTLSPSVQQTDDINDINIETSNKTNILDENLPKKTSSIPLTQRFYEFYNAPITKFWYNAIFYLLFLFLFTYMVLVRTPAKPSIAGKDFE